MYVKNFMTQNPICINVDAMISEAVEVMDTNHLHRIPVISNNRLVGLLTEGLISKNGASKATSLSIFELNYLLSKTSIEAVMIKDVITINQDRFLEDASLLMFKHDIGCLPVVDDQNNVVGILTSNDVLSAFIQMLGYQEKGCRVCVEVKDELGTIGDISNIFVRNNCNITHLGVYNKENGNADIVIRIDSFDTEKLVKDLNEHGYKVLNVSVNRQQ